jgi:CheY-like chemotaxis protein
VRDAVPAGDPTHADLDEIGRAAERARTLVRQLLAFSRKQVLQPRVLDLDEVVGGVTPMLRRLIGEHIDLRIRSSESLPRIRADRSQLEQVIINLVVNARDAMPAGGRVDIGLANLERDSTRQVQLTVRDTGRGMSLEVMERAFEPFYSTKPKSEGTGLGLATVYGIVTQSFGSIGITSMPDTGTTVEVLLPATQSTVVPAELRSAPAGSASAGETILVVEDEDAVRRLTCRILAAQGYRVLDAPNGKRALVAWEEHEGTIDLLLTDVVMPGMSGKELADRLCTEPVFMSGYTDDVVLRHGVEGPRLVQKPFDADTLLAAVRGALDAAPQAA